MNVPSTPTRRVTRGQWCCHPRSSAATYNLHPPTLAPSNLHHLPLFTAADHADGTDRFIYTANTSKICLQSGAFTDRLCGQMKGSQIKCQNSQHQQN